MQTVSSTPPLGRWPRESHQSGWSRSTMSACHWCRKKFLTCSAMPRAWSARGTTVVGPISTPFCLCSMPGGWPCLSLPHFFSAWCQVGDPVSLYPILSLPDARWVTLSLSTPFCLCLMPGGWPCLYPILSLLEARWVTLSLPHFISSWCQVGDPVSTPFCLFLMPGGWPCLSLPHFVSAWCQVGDPVSTPFCLFLMPGGWPCLSLPHLVSAWCQVGDSHWPYLYPILSLLYARWVALSLPHFVSSWCCVTEFPCWNGNRSVVRVSVRLKSLTQYWPGFESQVRQRSFLPESAFSADSYTVRVQSHAPASLRSLKIPNTGGHTIVWTHKNTAHTDRNGWRCSWSRSALPK